MSTLETISKNIQDLLDSRKISIAELSNYLGVSRQTMTNYLKNTSVIDSVQLAKVAHFFNVDISQLYSNSNNADSKMIFRTALNYNVAQTEINETVMNAIEKYNSIADSVNIDTCYFPEQYNLSVNYEGKKIDINYECQDYFDYKLKIDTELKNNIIKIANEQRALLGLGNAGAINLIPALTKRGINLLFLDMTNDDISGLSICDELKGCYIVVNSKQNIERQLFTLAHEYAHIILHRPLYKRRIMQNFTTKKKCFLDYMADCFAGYLLCPEYMISEFQYSITESKNNLQALCNLLIPIKLNMNVSLSALMMSLRNYGYISSHTLNEYFNILTLNGKRKYEPCSISENQVLRNYFFVERDKSITNMIHKYYSIFNDATNTKEWLGYFTNLSEHDIELLIKKWSEIQDERFMEMFEN
ncbi:MAG: ImmA/IrrE family metallo-endopeptidase [Eubacterium sp.]|nr:ImmA/IrrE family metallo-endopeptidase [Eubacterium sp.]